MRMRGILTPRTCVLWAALLWLLLAPTAVTQGTATVSGVVTDDGRPVPSARVRVRATDNLTLTAADGSFELGGLQEGVEIEVTAWADGYYIASTHVTPTVAGLVLALRPYHTSDHPDYPWADPTPGASEGACGNCHPMIIPQWQNNAHGGAVSNPRFFSLYNGTDVSATVQVSPGYLLDFPGTAGSCANCHAPAAGIDGYLSSNMNDLRGEVTAGIHCDYCHKVGGVWLDPGTGFVYPNAPGAQSQRVLRPPAGDNIFFGPYDDIHDPDTYLPLISQSQFCAPCHQFSFWGTPIYESYDEWLASPYAETGITCQDCHMPPNGDTSFALPEVGGLEHPAESIPSHLQLGAGSEELLQNTVEMSVSAGQAGSLLRVQVVVTNTQAGHHVPTDFPGRHMILLVTALGQGEPLLLWRGSSVPVWGGEHAGRPGKAYAKVLRDVSTGESPVVSYWKQTLIESDNRLAAFETDLSTFDFALPQSGGRIEVEATLLFRRAFPSLVDQRGWDSGEIMMENQQLTLSTMPGRAIYLPTILRSG